MTSASRWLTTGSMLAAALAVMSCQPVVDVPGAGLAIVDGNNQKAFPRSEFVRPLRVRATDDLGNGVPGALIKWTVSGGTLFPDTSRTNAQGIATAPVWRVQGIAQPQSLTATARLEGTGEVMFNATVAFDAFVVTPVPETARFSALDDTVRVMIRLRDPATGVDTLVRHTNAGWTVSGSVTVVGVPGTSGSVWQSIRNGTSRIDLGFGDGFTNATMIVKQVPVASRIVRVGSTLPAPDTVLVGVDSSFVLGVVAVDARNRIIEDSSLVPSVTWETSNPAAATVTASGTVRAAAEGFTAITARFDGVARTTTVSVWTMRPRAIAVGGHTSCSILVDASLACWGLYGMPVGRNVAAPPSLRFPGPFAVVDLSESGGCGVTPAGVGYCWGSNTMGQLGNGSISQTSATAPVAIAGNLTFATVSHGFSRSCGLTTSGKAYCWGSGGAGALGIGTYGAVPCSSSSTTLCSPIPAQVSGGFTWKQVSAGDAAFACGIADDDRAYCWGSNTYSQLGTVPVACNPYTVPVSFTTYCSNVPVEVDGGRRYKFIAAGPRNACAITTEGALWCWGGNGSGVIGSDAAVNNPNQPQLPIAVSPERRFASVHLGTSHSCAIDESGAAWCWGSGSSGKLGSGTTITGSCPGAGTGCQRTPVAVVGGLTFKWIDIGTIHTCGITTANVVYCWGYGPSLGTGATGGVIGDTPASKSEPARVVFQAP